MANRTHSTENMFHAGIRLRECREWRKMTQDQLAEAIQLLPGNNGKMRSPKQIGYIENGTRAMSMEYAHLLADALHVRVEYLRLMDDYKTESERLAAHASAITGKQDLIIQIMQLHGYVVEDVTKRSSALKDVNGREYREPTFMITSPKGAERFMSPKDLLQILEDIDDYIEYQCSKQFRKLIDGVKNIYD